MKSAYFDLSGVLLTDGFADLTRYEDGFGIPVNALQVAKNRYWLDLRLGKITEKEFWQKTFEDAGIVPGDDFIGMVRTGVLESHQPYEHVFDLSDTLRRAGVMTGIMTNTCREWLDYWNEKFSLSGSFSPIITSYDLGDGKA